MRFTPLVGKKLWFGPRSFGWGWDPVSWEGWAAVAAWVVVLIGASQFRGRFGLGLVVGGIVGLLVTMILKGTPPGGAEDADRLKEARRYAKRTPEMMDEDRQRRRMTQDEPSVTAAAQRLRSVPRRRRRH